MSTPDPRSTDSISRYTLPYPLAALYRMAYGNHEAAVRLGFSFRLAEGLFRFLALTNLADLAANAAPVKKMGDWLRKLETAGTGTWLGLVRSTTRHLAEHHAPFLTELPGILDEDWETASGAVVDRRNRWAHDEVQVTNAEAAPLLKELADPMRRLLTKAQFLGRYRLGVAQGLRSFGKDFQYFWYPSRGMEEVGEPLALRGAAVTDNWIMLMNPARGEALYLAPFFYWGLTTGDRASHVAWLHGWDRRADGQLVGRYRHPVYRQDVVRGLPEAGDPEGDGVTCEEYLKRIEEWPGRVELKFNAESLHKLADVGVPAFQERYRMIGKLGEGGMGAVWEVKDVLLGRRCALKLLHGHFVRSPQAVRRFLKEGRLLAHIRHPAIVEVFDVGIGPDLTPYLVMGLIEGEDLEQRLARAGPFRLREAVELLTEVLDALEAIHQAGIVHRDVKPANLILGLGGVTVVDFGIAAVPDGTRLTQSMDRMGTLAYMAPEQAEGNYSPRSDIYSCGRLLFVLLTGRYPRPGERLRDAVPDIPQIVEDVYQTATALSPEDRFTSAKLMADVLLSAIVAPLVPESGRDSAKPTADSPLSAPTFPTVEPATSEPEPRRLYLPESREIDFTYFAEVERTFPYPVARAVQGIPFANSAGSSFASRFFDAFRVAVQFSVFATLPRLGPIREEMRQALGHLFGRPTLSSWVAALREVGGQLSRQGDDCLAPFLGRMEPDWLVAARNRLIRHETAFDDALVKPLSSVLDSLRFLCSEILIFGNATSVPRRGTWREGDVEAMGIASLSGWAARPQSGEEYRPVVANGVYLRSGDQVRSLDPLVKRGEDWDDLLLYLGTSHGQFQYFSVKSWDNVTVEGTRELSAAIRQALKLGP